MQEIWKDIEGFEGYYQISNLGNVKSLSRKAYNHFTKEHLMTPVNTRRGYFQVKLNKGKYFKSLKIHRLVATAFIPNPNNLPQVNHKDGDKHNNCVDNLEWCTNKENMQHASKNGLLGDRSGNNNAHTVKINQYDLQGNFIKQWNSVYDILNAYNTNRNSIWRSCKGLANQACGYIWKYAD